MYSEISAALQSVKTLIDLAKSASSFSQQFELQVAVRAVEEKLSQAIAANLASTEKQALLLERIRMLEEEKLQLENWERTAADYSLQQIGTGIFAYVYKPAVETPKERHWACAKCFHDRKLLVLQREHRIGYVCHGCGSKISALKNGQIATIDSAYG
ncbi:hypothetical protein [Nitrosovibrio sp. Nv4]|uniref:hypothetical protein n=1 Tax=Nitrosovibrio sp. Nv4 TaxID=1945880 RepID=UPI000BD85852|nr:hypothetical protein [Nitrosovibrio sp. Nv4]SOD42404.1 hypothetical protein SAMN06298226_2743 [Nitrosovibrio sp. Nv4]